MTAQIIDGKRIAEEVIVEMTQRVAKLKASSGITPGLAAVLVGDDPASQVYVRNKTRQCAAAGVFTETYLMPTDSTERAVFERVKALNADRRFHGILVQLPLPSQVNESNVINAMDPAKDVDGLHPVSQGLLASGEPSFVPATPQGVQELLVRTGNSPEGKHVVICGRSNLVGRPLALLLMRKAPGANATVTVCHTGTRDIGEHTRRADILVVATGKARWVTADMVRDGAVVIDVGTNRIADPTAKSGSRLVGDVDYEQVAKKASWITPVPGG
ncbi:MAG: bifunctional 5,10-methylene-tetrahydrofolate dehydrogenase/5,10-methylene-tetrahydrofolate cyclohydrolase, partial [Chloroflexi bacterium]|nr:bifunctional 5,10-methylene-tetrahydrofolate dehydrogenase/5,10-methylene-tetrahydrofolate cyclohydrolase [Chloroflexota bacterium]